MDEWKLIMLMNRKEGDSMDVEMGVLQGLLVLPVLLVRYLADLFSHVEKKEEDHESEGISFVDAVAWVVEDDGVGECAQKLDRCAKEVQQWARRNACPFDIETIEAVLFTQKRSNKEQKMKARIRVGNHKIQFNKQVTG